MERIAIAADGNAVASHFGRCTQFVLVDVDQGQVVGQSTRPCPAHEPGSFPAFVASLGATHIVAGGMGPRAVQHFANLGITPLIGVAGSVDEVVQSWLAGTLVTGGSLCQHQGCHDH
ncbi:MAG: NifB/NifX family molybdenum-iron cluster-binding protein [Armatimonadota bacterium]